MRDADFRKVMTIVGALFGMIAFALVLSWGMYAFSRAHSPHPGATPETFTGPGTLPPDPQLQNDPHADLVKLHAREDSILLTYGWVSRDSGIVRVPISRAMDLVVEKGLPVRTASVKEGSQTR
jgi:hypothetical protein